ALFVVSILCFTTSPISGGEVMKPFYFLLALTLSAIIASNIHSQVPQIIIFQGRVALNRSNLDGIGLFKFSLVNSNGTVTFWSNDGSGIDGGEPNAAVPVLVEKGAYSVGLGDSGLPNMTPIAPAIFTNSDIRVRVWFNEGKNAFQQLSPDLRISAVGYARVAAIATTAIGTPKFAGMLGGDVAGPQGGTVVLS